jgi:mannose-6-phosphate isomerase class I
MIDILFLKPYLENKIWGGSNLKSLNIKLPSKKVGEA